MFYLKGALSHLYVQEGNTFWFTTTNAKAFNTLEEAQIEADKMNAEAYKYAERVYITEELE